MNTYQVKGAVKAVTGKAQAKVEGHILEAEGKVPQILGYAKKLAKDSTNKPSA